MCEPRSQNTLAARCVWYCSGVLSNEAMHQYGVHVCISLRVSSNARVADWSLSRLTKKGLKGAAYIQGWPEPYIYTVYDRIFDDFPAKNTVYTPYIYGSGQPYIYCS